MTGGQSPNLPAPATEHNTADLVKISKMLAERDKQRHVQRMDVLTMCCALLMALVCVGAAIFFGANGQPGLVVPFLGAPIGVALVNGLLGLNTKRKP